MGIPVIGAKEEFPGMEAEDLISKAALALDGNTVVVAYDKDLLQIVGQPAKDKPKSDVFYYNPQKKLLLTRQNLASHIRADYSFPTRADISGPDFAVYLAVTGDTIDRRKGDWWYRSRSLLPSTTNSYPPGSQTPRRSKPWPRLTRRPKRPRNKNITADWKRALLNLQLTDLRTSRQLGLAIDGNIPQPQPDKEAFRQVLEDLTMGSFLQQYDSWFAPFEALQPASLTESPELCVS